MSRSFGGGTNWTNLEPALFADAFAIVMGPDSNRIFIAVETGVHRSSD